jgi:mono/diheme cytochrome c family protein
MKLPAGTLRIPLALGLAAVCAQLLAGCDRLARGTKIMPLDESEFFANGQSSRRPPAHSIAQSGLRLDTLLYSGRNPDGTLATLFPWPVNGSVLIRGRQQYLAICANCHAPDGYGHGIIVRRGFPSPPSYHIHRLLEAPVGHFYQVITNGYGAMYPYKSIVDVDDRWAIIAYIRALQRSQHAAVADVPPSELAQLQKGAGH